MAPDGLALLGLGPPAMSLDFRRNSPLKRSKQQRIAQKNAGKRDNCARGVGLSSSRTNCKERATDGTREVGQRSRLSRTTMSGQSKKSPVGTGYGGRSTGWIARTGFGGLGGERTCAIVSMRRGRGRGWWEGRRDGGGGRREEERKRGGEREGCERRGLDSLVE